MVLQENVPFGGVTEVGPIAVFAIGNERVPFLIVAVVLEQLRAVEPVFDVATADDNEGGVELVDVEWLLFGCGDEVVKGAELAVTLHAELGVGVTFVVEDLELAAYGRAGAFIHAGIYEVFDTAIGALGDLEIYGEHEVAVLAGGDNVASIGALAAVGLEDFEYAVLNDPSLLGEAVEASAAPTLGGLAVPEELPALSLFASGEGVGNGVDLWRATVLRGGVSGHVLGADADVAPGDGLAFLRFIISDSVYLQGDETRRGLVVDEVGAGHAVDPCADACADGFDARCVPFVVLKSTLCGRVLGEGIEPSAARFIIDTARPGTAAGVYLELVAVDASVLIALEALAAQLYAGVEGVVNAEVELEDEVAVCLLGAEEGVLGVRLGVAYDGAVLNAVVGLAAALCPAAEALAVEEGGEGLGGEGELL